MTYATHSDIVELYSAEALIVADRDGDGEAEAAAIGRALSMASAEIDTYVSVRYGLPLPSTPEILRQWCVDIACYRLAQTADVLTEELRRRYEDALAALKRLAKGEQALVFPVDPDADPEEEPVDNSPRPIVAGGPARLFSREKLREF